MADVHLVPERGDGGVVAELIIAGREVQGSGAPVHAGGLLRHPEEAVSTALHLVDDVDVTVLTHCHRAVHAHLAPVVVHQHRCAPDPSRVVGIHQDVVVPAGIADGVRYVDDPAPINEYVIVQPADPGTDDRALPGAVGVGGVGQVLEIIVVAHVQHVSLAVGVDGQAYFLLRVHHIVQALDLPGPAGVRGVVNGVIVVLRVGDVIVPEIVYGQRGAVTGVLVSVHHLQGPAIGGSDGARARRLHLLRRCGNDNDSRQHQQHNKQCGA